MSATLKVSAGGQAVILAPSAEPISLEMRKLAAVEEGLVETFVRVAEEEGLTREETNFVTSMARALRNKALWTTVWKIRVALIETLRGLIGVDALLDDEVRRAGLPESVVRPPVRNHWVATLARELEAVQMELKRRASKGIVMASVPVEPLCYNLVQAQVAPADPRPIKRTRFGDELPLYKEVFGPKSPPLTPRVGVVTQTQSGTPPSPRSPSYSPIPYSPSAPPYDCPSPGTLVR